MSVPSLSGSGETESSSGALRDTLLSVFEQSLQAQLSAVRRLRAGASEADTESGRSPRRRKGRSQVDLAEDILKSAGGGPLHISEILARILQTTGRRIDSESLVSALSKRVARKDRFRRSGRNIFALL
jgi:hypothetical protein